MNNDHSKEVEKGPSELYLSPWNTQSKKKSWPNFEPHLREAFHTVFLLEITQKPRQYLYLHEDWWSEKILAVNQILRPQ